MAFDAQTNQEIGLRLRRLREARDLTRERLAEYADISVQFLADIETGRKGMTVQTLRKLALALHCSADAIVFGEPEEKDGKKVLLTLFATLDEKQRELTAEVLLRMLKALPGEEARD